MVREEVAALFLWIAKACLWVGVWPKELKASKTVIIPKPGKLSYDVPKAFRPIILLNTMGKLFEKMIANRLQFVFTRANLEEYVRTPLRTWGFTSLTWSARGGPRVLRQVWPHRLSPPHHHHSHVKQL